MIVVAPSVVLTSIRGKMSRLPFCDVFATFWAAKAWVVNRPTTSKSPRIRFDMAKNTFPFKKLVTPFEHLEHHDPKPAQF